MTIEGFANHAGTTAMNNRQDALLAAAKFIEAVNRIVTSVPGRQVGTVGRINALPGAPNVIPGKVVLSLELRDLDAAKINMLFEKIQAEAQKIAADSKTKFDFKEINVNIPAPTDPRDPLVDLRCSSRTRSLNQTDAVRRRSRCAGHGAAWPSRHDLRPQRRRHQPLAPRIFPPGRHRQRRQRVAAHVAQVGSACTIL